MALEPHPLSVIDPRGRLFEADGRILRGIRPPYVGRFESLLASPAMERLFALGLVRTEKTDVRLDGYPLVLSHKRVDFVTDWKEWPAHMLRDAAVMICDLNIELIARGYGIHDVHPWNVLIDYTRPVYVDFGAVNPLDFFLEQARGWRASFRGHWVWPLTLLSFGLPGFARSISRYQDWSEPIDRFLRGRPIKWLPLWYTWLERSTKDRPSVFFRRLKARLKSLRLPAQSTAWAEYYRSSGLPPHGAVEVYSPRMRTVRALLERVRPKTVLDIGCGNGWYSILAERMAAKVVALDLDERHADALYQLAKAHNLNILSLLGDFTLPIPRYGRKFEFPSSTERLVCDVSVMLGLIHRLVFWYGVPFERVAHLLNAHTSRFAIVEFVPAECKRIEPFARGRMEWYSADNLIQAMARYFRLVEVLESDPPRKILLFEKSV